MKNDKSKEQRTGAAYRPKNASPDVLAKPKKSNVELSEEELTSISGGPTAVEYKDNTKV